MFDYKVPKCIRAALDQSDFRVVCLAPDEGPAEMMVMDVIGDDFFGDGLTASKAVDFIRDNKDRDILVRINSPGGLAYEGLQIYNALGQHQKNVTVRVEGLAFSAASIIAMAGDTIEMHEASDIGIHRAAVVAIGNQFEMQDAMNWLRNLDEHLVNIYTARTGQSRDTIRDMLDGVSDGTLMRAEEAVELGFADKVIPAKAKSDKKESKNRIDETKTRQICNAWKVQNAERQNQIAAARRKMI